MYIYIYMYTHMNRKTQDPCHAEGAQRSGSEFCAGPVSAKTRARVDTRRKCADTNTSATIIGRRAYVQVRVSARG